MASLLFELASDCGPDHSVCSDTLLVGQGFAFVRKSDARLVFPAGNNETRGVYRVNRAEFRCCSLPQSGDSHRSFNYLCTAINHPYFMLELNVLNETDKLEAVILGIADSPGPPPSIEEAYDPKSKEFIKKGAYPKEADMVAEMGAVAEVLERYGIKVYRPELLENVNQIFSRDIAFVIGNQLVVANVVKDRAQEKRAISGLLAQIDPERITELPGEVRIEGGDVMPWNGKIFMGYSEEEDFAKYKVARTNRAGVDFIREKFPDWEVHAFELEKSDDDPRRNALHLDCCFQPFGRDMAVIFPGGFKHGRDAAFLIDFFGKDKVIEIDREEMYNMASNFFSISPEVVISERGLTRLNEALRARGLTVEEVPYAEIAKQEGLLRCSTLPLRRIKV